MRETEGREVVIVEAVRTPIGRGHKEKGYYRDTHPNELLGRTLHRGRRPRRHRAERGRGRHHRLRAAVRRADVQRRAQRLAAGRAAGQETPATTVDRQCGSAQQAVNFAAALIGAGVHDVAIGSGVEHMGHIPMGVGFNWVDEVGNPWPPELMERYQLIPQGLSAEMIADQWEIPRSELDELGVRSHRLAHQATEEGRFEREIVPFAVNGDTYVSDQGIRPDTTPRGARRAQTGVQARRQDHGGQLVADLRRRRRRAPDVGGQGRRARAARRGPGSSIRRRWASIR